MENDILKIEVAKQDLKEAPEYWASESYETMIGKLQKLVEAKTGYPPFRNTKVIREVSFKITSRTTLGQIKELLSDIENDYNISCFQIAIDRGSNTAHLLFTWIHPRTALPVRFNNKTKVKLLSAYFVRRLHLEYPKDMTEWVRYFIMDAYIEDKSVFRKALASLSKKEDSIDKTILFDSLLYAQYMSEGKVK